MGAGRGFDAARRVAVKRWLARARRCHAPEERFLAAWLAQIKLRSMPWGEKATLSTHSA